MKNFVLPFLALGAIVLAPSGRPRAADKPQQSQPLVIGTEKQLFVDDHVVAKLTNVRRVLGTVEKANGGKPIFTDGRMYGSVFYDEGRFKLWYRKHEPLEAGGGFGYAESNDGVHFEKKATLSGINFAGDVTMSVEIDPHQTDPNRQYIAAYDAPGMAAGIAHSADGVHWTPDNNGRPVTHRAADSYNQVLWDPGARTYRLFTRTDFGAPGGLGELRGTRSMTNPDIVKSPTDWKTVRNWIFDREGSDERKRRQIYTVSDTIYHGVHFAYLTVYEWVGDFSEGPVDFVKRHEHDVLNLYLATSRDADNWDLSWVYSSRPIIPRGDDGAFDKDLIVPASRFVTHADKHWLYYGGSNERHGNETTVFPRTQAIGLAWLRLDGFVGLAAGDAMGTVVTRPFVLDGNAIEFNVDASRGSTQFELLSEDGRPMDGFSGANTARHAGVDQLRLKPAFAGKDDLSALAGRTVCVKVSLQNARLYSFQVAGK